MTTRLTLVLDLLWQETSAAIDRLSDRRLHATLEGVLLDRAARQEARLIADISDWAAYPPNACSCPKKAHDWDYRMYSRSCLRGDHRQEARVFGQGVA